MTPAERVNRIIAVQLGVAEADVTPDKALAGDMGADSLDTVEIVMALEDEFGFEIADLDGARFIRVKDILEYVAGKATA